MALREGQVLLGGLYRSPGETGSMSLYELDYCHRYERDH